MIKGINRKILFHVCTLTSDVSCILKKYKKIFILIKLIIHLFVYVFGF